MTRTCDLCYCAHVFVVRGVMGDAREHGQPSECFKKLGLYLVSRD
jgi:hypothetical protein